jgi:rhodanese-related sulfurtransferase
METESWPSQILRSIFMNRITREELKAKLDRKQNFRLINCLDEWAFRIKRIPGSIHFERNTWETLDSKEEVIVYCSNPGCTASVLVYQQFVEHGFQNVWHYAGGIADWEDGGYPLEGDWVHPKQSDALGQEGREAQ